MPRKRRVGSISDELLYKSREVALSAVQIFNNPLMRFKSEAYIVLMMIAWTYLVHAYYRKNKIEYRYFQNKGSRRKFDRTKRGAYKYWELERCLNDKASPIDRNSANNLRFLIGLRHEIEHQMTMNLDSYLSGRYQACALNYNHYIKALFGERFGIDKYLAYSIQFLELSYDQLQKQADTTLDIPPRVKTYIMEFDHSLTEEEYNDERFSYRLFFSKKTANRLGQADRVIEFVDPSSELAQSLEREYWVKQDVERPKYLPGQIVELMQSQGFINFNMHHHTLLWKELDAKNPGKGYGVDIGNRWFWYKRWVEEVRQHCEDQRETYCDDE